MSDVRASEKGADDSIHTLYFLLPLPDIPVEQDKLYVPSVDVSDADYPL